MAIEFIKLSEFFRDEEQKTEVQNIIQTRLADDRNQEECRYLMRFWWQLSMAYQEVTFQELESFVSDNKLLIINELLESMEKGDFAIDSWIKKYQQLPVIEDRGFKVREN